MLLVAASADAALDGYLDGSFKAGTFAGTGVRGNRYVCQADVLVPLPASPVTAVGQSAVLGIATKITTSTGGQIAYFCDPTQSVGIGLRVSGTVNTTLEVWDLNLGTASAAIASAASALTLSSWNFIELKYVVSASGATTLTVRVNGTQVIAPTAVTLSTTAQAFSRVMAKGSSANPWMDLHVLNTAGAANNDFVGDCRVEHLTATAEGANTGWTLSAGGTSKTSAVTTATGTETIRTTMATVRQTFVISDLVSTTGVVKGASVLSLAHGETNGVQKSTGVVRTGGVSYDATSYSLASSAVNTYTPSHGLFDVNPATGVAFTAAEINALEAGVVVI